MLLFLIIQLVKCIVMLLVPMRKVHEYFEVRYSEMQENVLPKMYWQLSVDWDSKKTSARERIMCLI